MGPRRDTPFLRRILSRFGIVLASFVVGLCTVEGLVRLLRIDERVVLKSVFFQGADLPVHRDSRDSFLHYELKPGGHYQGVGPRGERYEVNIDATGARCPPHPAVKRPGNFRVLCFGGSTMYGAVVNDAQTIAARLEARLNNEPIDADPNVGGYEVWNFGTSAYTLGQAAHLARKQLTGLDPDLIIVQVHNQGPRPFLMPDNNRTDDYPIRPFLSDPDFFVEQFSLDHWIRPAPHRAALHYSAAYRSLVALSPHLIALNWCPTCDKISQREARALTSEAERLNVPVIYLAIPADMGKMGPAAVYPELPGREFIDLYRPRREPEFYLVHPPAAVLDEYAALLAEALRERGLLSRAKLAR